ncbi:MAG: hypothetical protein HGA45_23465 [Chloroflexales bacterium]|nr:hypothetical protein [Chloroflexales bacterium]
MQQNRRGGNSWIGWLIFIFLVFGSRFLPPIAGWLSQATGLPISVPLIIAAVVGLGVVASIVSSVVQEINKNRDTGQNGLPTGLPPALPPRPAAPPTPPARPPSARIEGTAPMSLPSAEQRLPGPPSFEPIINPRVLTLGIIGLVIIGGFFFLALLIAGAL